MPIHHDVEQRSEAWDLLRLGRPTASCFHKILTPGSEKIKPKLSAQFERYAHHLIAERLLGRHINTYTSPEMEKGAALEDSAADWYEFSEGIDTQKIGFVTTDDGRIGCSPDRLVGEDGLIEIKCPEPATQVGYLLTGTVARTYWPQIQGQLWVCQRQWIDVLAYSDEHPKIPHHIVRVERDDKYINLLEEEVTNFADQLDKAMGAIRKVRGDQPPAPKVELKEMLRRSLEEGR
jgi:hypothetical protein